jgi:hypothetical protein
LDDDGGAPRFIGTLHQTLEMGPDRFSKLGQRRRAGGAPKQRRADLPLKSLDGVGKRWLRDTATSRRSREISFTAQRQKISDMTDLHGQPRITTGLKFPVSGCEKSAPRRPPKTGGRAGLFPLAGINPTET